MATSEIGKSRGLVADLNKQFEIGDLAESISLFILPSQLITSSGSEVYAQEGNFSYAKKKWDFLSFSPSDQMELLRDNNLLSEEVAKVASEKGLDDNVVLEAIVKTHALVNSLTNVNGARPKEAVDLNEPVSLAVVLSDPKRIVVATKVHNGDSAGPIANIRYYIKEGEGEEAKYSLISWAPLRTVDVGIILRWMLLFEAHAKLDTKEVAQLK